jgi:hypothetical protein
MIDAAKNPGFFDGRDVKRLLDHTQHFLISFGVRTVQARIDMRQAVAHRAVKNVLFGFLDSISQSIGLIFRDTDDIKGDPLGSFPTDAGNFFQLFDEPG